LVAIHHDTTEHEREAGQSLLTQIKVLREAQQRVIEEIHAVSSPEVNQHPTAPTDLHFKLNKMRSKVTVSHENPERSSRQLEKSRKGTSGPNSKGGRSPDNDEDRGLHRFHPLNLPIDQILIFHISAVVETP